MSEKTIWAVTSGCYSDYGVVAIFSSKELAEEYVRISTTESISLYQEERRVEEFVYHDELPEYHVVLTARETVGTGPVPYRESTEVSWGKEASVRANIWERVTHQGAREFSLDVHVRGTDHERVRKVFSEKLAQAKADPRLIG